MRKKSKIKHDTIVAFDNCPTTHTMKNRQAGMEMLHEAAARGNVIALQTEAIMGFADASGYYVNTPVMYADDDDGWDDVRPY